MKPVLTMLATAYLSVLAHLIFSDRISVFGVRPELILLGVLTFSLNAPPTVAMFSGFLGALLWGATTGVTYGGYIFATTIACYAISRVKEIDIEIGPVLGGAVVMGFTLFALILLLFSNPAGSINSSQSLVGYLQNSLKAAMYNGVLAVPLCAVFRRILKTRSAGV